MYREIYVKDQNVAQALENIENNIPDSDEKKYILEFVKNSERGITKG